jgi:hypothetical protein
MWKWLLFLRGIAIQAPTPVSVRRRRGRLEPMEHLQQLPLEYVEFGNLLLHAVQLLRHQCLQAGTHSQTLPAVELGRQHFELGEGEPQGTRAANEQEPMHIASGVLPVPGGTPAWHRQHTDLLVIANGFGWDAGSACELAHRQRSFHGRSPCHCVGRGRPA